MLRDAGVAVLDVAGRGGTRFDQIRKTIGRAGQRLPNSERIQIGVIRLSNRWSWFAWKTALWASGGIRHGVDVAKALCLGASACGIGEAQYPAALDSPAATIEFLQQMIFDIQVACYGCGIASTDEFTANTT